MFDKTKSKNMIDGHMVYLDNVSSIFYSVILNSCGIKKTGIFTFVCIDLRDMRHGVRISDIRKMSDCSIYYHEEDEYTMTTNEYLEKKLSDEEKVQLHLVSAGNLHHYSTTLFLDFFFGTAIVPQRGDDEHTIRKLCLDVINSTDLPQIKNNLERYTQKSFIDDVINSLDIIELNNDDFDPKEQAERFYFTDED